MIISNNDFVENITNLSPLGKSDHSVLHCICNLKNKKSVNVSKFNFNKGDYVGLCEYFRDEFDLDKFDDCESVNESWLYLKSTLESGKNLFIPRINNNAWRKKEAWKYPIDRSFKELINKKHKSWTKFQKNKDKTDLAEYKRLRNLVRKQSRLINRKKQEDIATSCKNNPKKFWQHVKSKSASCSSGISDIKVFQDNVPKVVSSDIEKTALFSDYFSKIYTIEDDVRFIKLPLVPIQNPLPSLVFSESTVADKLDKLKTSKSPGPDLLHPRVIVEIRSTYTNSSTYYSFH